MLISKCIICTHQICTTLKSWIFISKFLWMMCPLWVPTILFLSDSQSLPLSTLWVTRTGILCVGRVGEGQTSYTRGIGHLKSWCETDFQFGFQHNTDPLLSNVSPINNLQEAGRQAHGILPNHVQPLSRDGRGRRFWILHSFDHIAHNIFPQDFVFYWFKLKILA